MLLLRTRSAIAAVDVTTATPTVVGSWGTLPNNEAGAVAIADAKRLVTLGSDGLAVIDLDGTVVWKRTYGAGVAVALGPGKYTSISEDFPRGGGACPYSQVRHSREHFCRCNSPLATETCVAISQRARASSSPEFTWHSARSNADCG